MDWNNETHERATGLLTAKMRLNLGDDASLEAVVGAVIADTVLLTQGAYTLDDLEEGFARLRNGG